MNFPLFMSSWAGRLIRIVAGIALAWWGYVLASTLGWVLVTVGAVVFLAGLLDFCIFAPLFGQPLSGKAIREHGNE